MLSEEMELNHALEEAGIEPVETDLGEYIVQLLGDTPFHIIAPAIHKTREDVSELFADKLNAPRYREIEDMAAEARRQLRAKFIQAGMGITGVNYLVADTGTVVLVTNKGQRPHVHVHAPHPRGHHGDGAGHPLHGRSRHLPAAAHTVGDRAEAVQLRHGRDGAPSSRRRRRA